MYWRQSQDYQQEYNMVEREGTFPELPGRHTLSQGDSKLDAGCRGFVNRFRRRNNNDKADL